MPCGYSGGYKRQLWSTAPYRFARRVYEVLGMKKSNKRILLSSDGTRASFEIPAGSNNCCFVLPATELVSNNARNNDAQIFTRGGGFNFDLITSRSYSLRVLAFQFPSSEALFGEASNTLDGMVDRSTRGNFGVLGNSNCLGTDLLLGENGILVTQAGVDACFFPVSTSA